MEEMKPTPRPWRIQWFSGEDSVNKIVDANDKSVCDSSFHEILPSDAELIVSAVNQSDHVKILVEALEDIIGGVDYYEEPHEAKFIAEKSLERYRRAMEGK